MTEPDPRPNIVVPSTATAMGLGSGLIFGVKWSISDYPKLREDKGWLPFKCGLVATAATHALSEVLDPQHIPLTNDEIVEFKAKNTYMYNVFTNVLLIAKSKVPLRTH